MLGKRAIEANIKNNENLISISGTKQVIKSFGVPGKKNTIKTAVFNFQSLIEQYAFFFSTTLSTLPLATSLVKYAVIFAVDFVVDMDASISVGFDFEYIDEDDDIEDLEDFEYEEDWDEQLFP